MKASTRCHRASSDPTGTGPFSIHSVPEKYMQNSTHQHARQLYDQGISICPVQVNGTKRPQGKWKGYQEQRCSSRDLLCWYDRWDPFAIGVVCGTVSDNLLVVDIDDSELIAPFESELRTKYPALFEALVAVETGSGKRHLYLFCDEPFGPRQTFVKMSDNKWAIEFRSEGNYVIGPGSPTSTHKSGKPYHVIRGDIGEIRSFSPEEVATLVDTAKSFEEVSGPSAAEKLARLQVTTGRRSI